MDTLLPELLKDLHAFWVLVQEVWSEGLWGVNIGDLLIAIAIVLGFLAVRRIFTRVVLGRLSAWAGRSQMAFSKESIDALQGPVALVPVALGAFLALEYLELDGSVAELGGRVIRSLVVTIIFWSLYNLVTPLSVLLERLNHVLTSVMLEWLVKALRLAVAFVGVATVLDVWGIKIGPVLAGLGLIGVAVALGAQDLFKNLIGGILILVEKRFEHGDWVNIEGVVEGTVESIGFRSTVVRRFDKAPVFVPNARFADSPVINFSKMTHRRIYWKVGVLYSSSVEQLREIRDGIERYIVEDEAFASPSEVATFVRIDSFADSSIDIMIYCFTRTTDWGEWLAIKERFAYHIKELVEGVGSGFAFPSRSVYVETAPDNGPEIYAPPSD